MMIGGRLIPQFKPMKCNDVGRVPTPNKLSHVGVKKALSLGVEKALSLGVEKKFSLDM